MKKFKFYVSTLMLAGSISLVSPTSSKIVYAEEDEEILYEETVGGEKDAPIDDKVPSNVPVSVNPPANDPVPTRTDATREKNDNEIINADKDHYLDNTNYYPETDPSDNKGDYIPDDVPDEVDRKNIPTSTPTPTPTPTPTNTPTPTPTPTPTNTPTPTPTPTPIPTPEPQPIPKMGEKNKNNFKTNLLYYLSGVTLGLFYELVFSYMRKAREIDMIPTIDEEEVEDVKKRELK